MKLLTPVLTLFFLLFATVAFSQSEKGLTCKVLKDCKLKYTADADTSAYIIIKNTKHIEYHHDGKYFIKSDLKWVNECEYNATMTAVTLPDFPFKPGEVMNVKFEKIEDGIVSGKSTIRGEVFNFRFRLIK